MDSNNLIWGRRPKARAEAKQSFLMFTVALQDTTDGVFSYVQNTRVTQAIFPEPPAWREMQQGHSILLHLATTPMQYIQDNRSTLLAPAFENRRPQKFATVCALWSLDVNPLLLSSTQTMFIISTALYKRPAFTLPEKCQEKSFLKVKKNHYTGDYEDEVRKKWLGTCCFFRQRLALHICIVHKKQKPWESCLVLL